MSKTSDQHAAESFFGEVISTYTRAQAIEDGVLVDAGPMTKEVGFSIPVVLTSAVWVDCVVWNKDDCRQQVNQDQSGRLYDVLFMAAFAIRTSAVYSDRLLYELYRVPRDGYSTAPVPVTLKLIVGPGDTGEPTMTILLPNED